MKPSYGKYIFVFVITTVIFGLAFLLSSFLTQKRFADIQSIQDTLSVDLLSNETRFALLADSSSCTTEGSSPDLLFDEMATLAARLTYMEEHLSADDANLIQLKKYYSLVQIKDYLLTKQISEKCHEQFATILYFYGKNCDDCPTQGALLTELREKYPFVRVYSFDKELNTPAVQTLVTLFKITTPPTLIVQGKQKLEGLTDAQKLEALVPMALKQKYAKSQAEALKKAQTLKDQAKKESGSASE